MDPASRNELPENQGKTKKFTKIHYGCQRISSLRFRKFKFRKYFERMNILKKHKNEKKNYNPAWSIIYKHIRRKHIHFKWCVVTKFRYKHLSTVDNVAETFINRIQNRNFLVYSPLPHCFKVVCSCYAKWWNSSILNLNSYFQIDNFF